MRKQEDRLQKALPQILEGYCSMSPQPREIAEQEAKAFLKIIEDSSKYQFGFNHSTGYSMIGYTCAYLRYYYPEEFICAYLNCSNNADDIINGTELAKLKNVTMKNIRFGYSLADYTVDKANHTLYKGIESIKYLNAQIAKELYDLAQSKQYTSFIDLLKDINEKTSVNSRQLTILTGLGFFNEFGKNKYLLNLISLYNKFGSCKQIKKDKLESLGLSEYIMEKYAGKQTAKQYSQIDNIGLIEELSDNLENKSMDVIEQIKFEKEYLEYIVYTNPRVHESYYIALDYRTFKEVRKPYMTLYNIATGNQVKTKINSVKLYEQAPFGEYSILKVSEFTEKPKKKLINGEWVSTDEFEEILTGYEVIKK